MEQDRPAAPARYYTLVAAALLFVPTVAFSVSASESFRNPKLWAGAGIAFLGALGSWWLGRHGDRKADYGDAVWGLTAIAAAVSLVNTTHLLTGLTELMRLVALVLAFSLLRRAPDPWRALPAIILAGTVNATMALSQWAGWRPDWWVPWEGRHAVYGTFGNPNFLAEYLAPAIVLAVGWSLENGRRRRWAVGTVAGMLMLISLVLTVSRAGWLGLGTGLIVLVALGLPALRMEGRGKLLAMTATGFMAVATGTTSPLWTRIESSFSGNEPGVETRVFMWKVAQVQFREHPALGSGPGGYGLGYLDAAAGLMDSGTPSPAYAGITGEAHNDALQLLAERGAVGAVAWIAALVFLMVPAFRSLPGSCGGARIRIAASFGAVAAVLVESGFGFPVRIFPTAAVFLFALACLAPLKTAGPAWLCHAIRMRSLGLPIAGLVLLGLTVSADMALGRGKNRPDGEASLRAGLMILPWHGELHFRLGLNLMSQGRLGEATKEFNAALPGFKDPDVYFNLGVTAMREKKYADATGFFREGLRRYPRYKPAAWADLAEALWNKGDKTEAAVAASRAVGLDQGLAGRPALRKILKGR
jgi:O-antigen ligase